ncbi:hypothetical protein ACTMTF_15275 [Nonomuraea sp. ZG12]|uniref:hypothetical protein n=1 Tax=Nonomuraea sp. ZG12 TaxID=3452207 RepID=UPI003F8A8478
MSVCFTAELHLPGFDDTATVEMFQRDGEWWVTSKGAMVSADDTCTWENTPRTYPSAIDAFRVLSSEIDDLLGVGFTRKSEVWTGV